MLAPYTQAQSLQVRQATNATITAWSDWMARHQINEGAIAIAYEGAIVAEEGIGRTATDPAPVASLSKAITAACALYAMSENDTPAGTKLQKAMPEFFSKFRVKDRRLFSATLGHLITHDSGIISQFERRYTRFETLKEEQKEAQLRNIVLERLGATPGRNNYSYSNANYLALGVAIEEMTGAPYEAYCQQNVLAPLGITTAHISDEWAVLSSFGGWVISASDYVKFLHAQISDGLVRGQRPLSFRPKVHIGKNRYYGPGLMFRKTEDGLLVWHAGSWKWSHDGKEASFGAYALMLDNGLTISTNFSDAALDGAMEDLERSLWEAAR